MEPDQNEAYSPLPFDAHGIICKTYGENVIAIRTYANWLKAIG